ncbi:MAG: response regulator [Candidatus Eisenbacteria bacterium]|uniref:Response regulator n=1 Tax=Eiseniibacteriota bacterium TaxID=2212470 RepID=A0A938BRJ3_UNCEI|nr:response regulator [Candidatus Eisenbacteria bacterium]
MPSNSPDTRAEPLRLFLAEESETIVAQLRAWCAQPPGRVLVEAFPGARQLLRRAEVERPDLALVGLTMPRIDGLTALRLLQPAGIPTVIVAPDTIEGARGAVDALAAGAADCLIKRPHRGGERLIATREQFRRRIEAWTEPAAIAPAEEGAWYRLALDGRGRIIAGVPAREPFPAEANWLGFSFCRTRSVGRLLQAMAGAPERPGGGMLIGAALPARFTRALAETASRLWNRVVLELQPGESIRPGQWRVIPARAVLRPLAAGGGAVDFGWGSDRWCHERRLFAERIAALPESLGAGLRLYLFDEPEPRLRPLLRRLSGTGGAVLLHGERFPLRQWAGARPEREAPCAADGGTRGQRSAA